MNNGTSQQQGAAESEEKGHARDGKGADLKVLARGGAVVVVRVLGSTVAVAVSTAAVAVGIVGVGVRAGPPQGSAVAALGAGALQARALAGTVVHEGLGLLGQDGEGLGVDVPPLGVAGGAGDGLCGGVLGAAVAGGGGPAGVGGGEVGKLGGLFNLGVVVLDCNDAVLVLLRGILVHHAARVYRGHVGVHEGLDLAKTALAVGDAAKLGQEDGDAVVGEVLDLLVPAGSEVISVAPGVVVEGEEVGADIIVAAVEVVSGLLAVLGDVGSGVTDGDGAEVARAHVALDIAGGGLDIGGSVGRVLVVDDLVAGEKEHGVVVLGELVDDGEDGLEVLGVVRGSGVFAVDGVVGRVDIGHEVDASVGKKLHALVVVEGAVKRIDADGVYAEFLEFGNVALADGSVGEGVLVFGGAAGLVVNAADVEALAIGEEGCWGLEGAGCGW